jgi:PGF-CTERM protein
MSKIGAVVLSTLLVVSIVGAVTFGSVVAEHPEDAPDYTQESNFTIWHVSQSDHKPGDQQGSIRYSAAGEDAFRDQDAEEGVFIDYIIIDADWIDYSDCDVDNTASFGIDRGNNNSGTQFDEDLVQHQKRADFRDDGITVEFYNWGDIPEDPPYMAPEDAIVAEQGENSASGACLQYTDEPGWYRIDGFLNGTVADNGRNEQPSENAKDISTYVGSTWFYICDCESDEEAREELGQPPGETAYGGAPDDNETSGESTPTATPEAGADGNETNETSGESTPTATPEAGADGNETTNETTGEGTPEETVTPGAGNETTNETTGEETPEETMTPETGNETVEEPAGNETGTDQAPGQEGEMTPEADGGGPGFGPIVALVALLAAALVMVRRR